MKILTALLATAAAMTMSGTAFAQAGATPTYDCALFNECETAAPAVPDAAPATPSSKGGRTSSTRGWNLSRTLPPTGAKPTATKPIAGKPSAAAVVNRPGAKGAVPAPSRAKPRLTPAAPSQDMARVRLAQGITFVSGSANLTPAATQNVDKLAAAMLRPDKMTTRFRIEGHTDSVGGREANLELSKRRAASVSSYLVGKGVDASRLDMIGHGFEKTLAGFPGTSAANRRVEAKPIN
jgi:OmpA-OmpF porin, OOP family